MNPLIYIILVNYNGLKDTIECIESLEKIEYDNYKIVVVDNGSADESVKILRDRFSGHEIVETGKNLGFAGGNNVGFDIALENGAEYVLLLNNDTVVQEDILSPMLETFKRHSESGIVGGKIFYYDDRETISHAGGYIDFLRYTTVHYGMNKKDSLEFNHEREVTFVSGCFMMIKSDVIKRIGKLDEGYFMYYEDTDYCVKALDAGFRIIFNPEAVIYHKISRSSGGENSPFFLKWNTRNRLIFMNRYKNHEDSFSYRLSKAYIFGTRYIRYLIYKIKGDRERAGAIIEGMTEGKNISRKRV